MRVKGKPDAIKHIAQRAKVCKRSYYEFFKEFFPLVSTEKLVDNWHIKYICDIVQRMVLRMANRLPKEYDLIVNVSPGETKSTIISQLLIPWAWLQDPTLIFLTGSHNIGLATKHSNKSREVIKSDKFHIMYGKDYKIKRDADNIQRYSTNKGGERIVTSVGSKPIGEHAHGHIFDDTIDPEGVLSNALLNKTNRYFTSSLDSRKVNEMITPLILVMQRLAENDPTGYILSKYPSVKHISLPAESKYKIVPAILKRRYVGGYMNPFRNGKKALANKRAKMSEMDYAAQFGQDPTSLEGNIIRKKYIHVMNRHDMPQELYALDSLFFVDGAYTKNELNDPSGVLEAKYWQGIIYILDFIKFWEEFDDAINEIVNWMDEKDSLDSPIWIENKASGLSLGQRLKKTFKINAIDFKNRGKDKIALLKFVLKYIESGRVVFVKGTYLKNYIKQILAFPTAKHDEEIDCLIMAIFRCIIDAEKGGRDVAGQ